MILNKIKIFIIILFYFVIIIFVKFIFAWGYFHVRLGDDLNQSQYQIQIMDTNELAYEWLRNECPTQIYNINIQDCESMKLFLKEYKYLDTNLNNNVPGYNSFKQTQLNYISLKEPPKGLLGVYIIPRENPFQIKYSNKQYSNTLSELLNDNKISMKEIYCFWDVKEKHREQDVKIHHIVLNIRSHEIENCINNYLDSKNIFRSNRNVRTGCYNMTQKSGLIIPLPHYSYYNIQAVTNIYFDDGIRIMDINKGNIHDLLNMANGAKNIYIFSLIIFEPFLLHNEDFLRPFERAR
ncbi:MAG: hypothetical protein Q2306_01570 [Phytoplasma sp.]|uniref:hypothetical protein n=1 Tax=Phytoplasma sp. TaxID=2155 RepID=UPI002B40FDA5|nr:hypothetical protein [Phytoplasma sp.]WRH06577.1 MAG: hypothetical protein Q2306_01570 [Phytoplasma sp.]